MPPPPIFGDAARDVGVVEVFQEFESEDGAETDGHVGVPAEIVVDLEGVADRSQPRGHAVQLVDRLGEHFVGYGSQCIGEENLLGESHDEAFDAIGDFLEVHRAILDLVGYVVVLDDRSSHQLREEADVECELVDVFLRLDFLSVNVHNIADGLEGVEGDANGHDDLDEVDVPAKELIDVFNKEVEVFEVEQEAQVSQNGEQKQRLFTLVLRDQNSADVVDNDGEQHHRHIPRFSPGVEEDACQEQDIVLQLLPHQEVQGAHDRQEQKQECCG